MKILLLDDDLNSISVLADMLKVLNYEIIVFDDPVKALEYISTGDIDIVASDISMPEMDGLDVLKAVKKIDSEIPVILFTGMPILSKAIDAVNYGASAYFRKPIIFHEFVSTLSKIESKLNESKKKDDINKKLRKELTKIKKSIDTSQKMINVLNECR